MSQGTPPRSSTHPAPTAGGATQTVAIPLAPDIPRYTVVEDRRDQLRCELEYEDVWAGPLIIARLVPDALHELRIGGQCLYETTVRSTVGYYCDATGRTTGQVLPPGVLHPAVHFCLTSVLSCTVIRSDIVGLPAGKS